MNVQQTSGYCASRTAIQSRKTQSVTQKTLAHENVQFANTSGISQNNRSFRFKPAFQDTQTGTTYVSRFQDGRPAPFHLIDGLPEELVTARSAAGSPTAIKATVIAGFVRGERFYTREEAALVSWVSTASIDH